jgi:hypothetical protein
VRPEYDSSNARHGVTAARDLRHDRKVALKVLRPEISAEIGAEQFLREIKMAAGLAHPHILPVNDSGEADGLLFYTMPNMEGSTLCERLNTECQIAIDEALNVMSRVSPTRPPMKHISASCHYGQRRNMLADPVNRPRCAVQRSGTTSAETESLPSPRIDVRTVAQPAYAWLRRLLQITITRSCPLIVLTGERRQMAAWVAKVTCFRSDPLRATSMNHLVLALRVIRGVTE